MADPAGISNFADANTIFREAVSSVFSEAPPGVAANFCDIDASFSGKDYELDVLLSFPQFREWIGERQRKSLRAAAKREPLKTYEMSIQVPRRHVEYDNLNVFTQNINRWLGGGDWLDQVIVPQLLANTATGYDGSALLANSHAWSNSTGDNLTTDALSFASYQAAREAMGDFQDEDGKPTPFRPTHLLVGPELERTALEVTGSLRPVPVSNAGALDATSNVVAAVNLENYIGDAAVLVSPRITASQWFVMDLSRAGIRPFYCGVGRNPTAMPPSEDDFYKREKDMLDYFTYYDMAVVVGEWRCIYGSVTA